MKVFALRFRELRIEKGLTQKEIAVFLKTTNKKISFWGTDFTDPSLEEVVETARYFGVSTDYLLGLQDEFGNEIR
jgi:transcriptional regulator with XRE-family HTH domain